MSSIPILWILIIVIAIFVLVRLYFTLTSARCKSKVTLVGKTALVTGGSSGLGYQLGLELASRGCRVILAQRSTHEKLRETLIEETNNPNTFLEHVDMSSFDSVRDLAERLKSTVTKLDILINNAGVGNGPDILTKDGLSHTWQTNYYSPFLLTHLLVDLLKNSEAGRIIFTSSITAYFHSIHVEDKDDDRIKASFKFLDYANTKFLAIFAADYFAKKLKESNITCNSYHPGIVETPIFQRTANYYRGVMDFIVLWAVLFLKMFSEKNVEEGVQTALHLAISKKVSNVSGKFFMEATPCFKPRGANNKKFREKVWKTTEKVVGLKPDEKLAL
ncbi:unnamed protein product [Phaedon cochleariae]|uniref:Uncharacterized protein n=1 Tax=Phaedon cochleariae TaxID=80249 RepID=A0A9P0GVA8_PHACE|nr:unnamed protein product [Phaedon cochleariae]